MHQILMTAPFAISITLLAASAIVAVAGRRYRRELNINAFLPAAYLALHGSMGMLMHISHGRDWSHQSVGHVMNVMDVLGVILLVLIGLDAHQAVGRMRETLRSSRAAVDEYERARRDYEQLVRHRIANPLAVVDGGIDTLLRHHDRIDERTREELLRAMAASSRRLREFTPDPTSRTIEEVNLHATPRVAVCA